MIRFFDILFSGCALILLSPLFLITIIILRFSGEGEIFYLQDRVGKDKKLFKLYKFATMYKNSEFTGTGTITIKNDPRILPIGGYLRKSKINELPQLVNVFRGDMSLIGPRPQTMRCFNAFPMSCQKDIVKLRPGLSGIGSVIFHNEESLIDKAQNPESFYDDVLMPYKGSLEQWFVINHSIKNYFLLIYITIFIIFFSSSNIVWRVFKDLPDPPNLLANVLNFSD